MLNLRVNSHHGGGLHPPVIVALHRALNRNKRTLHLIYQDRYVYVCVCFVYQNPSKNGLKSHALSVTMGRSARLSYKRVIGEYDLMLSGAHPRDTTPVPSVFLRRRRKRTSPPVGRKPICGRDGVTIRGIKGEDSQREMVCFGDLINFSRTPQVVFAIIIPFSHLADRSCMRPP